MKIVLIIILLFQQAQTGVYAAPGRADLLFSAGSYQCTKCKNGGDKLKAIAYVLGIVSIILAPVAPLTLPIAGIFWTIGEVLYHICSLDKC